MLLLNGPGVWLVAPASGVAPMRTRQHGLSDIQLVEAVD